MHRPEPQTRRGSSRPGPGSSQEPGPFRDPWLRQRQALHDAANWLTVLLGHVEALSDRPGPEDRRRHLELARRAARAAHRLCALPPEPGRAVAGLDPRRHARRLLDHARRAAAQRQVDLRFEEDPEVGDVLADAAGFEDAVLNLLRNAIEASPPGGTVSLRVAPTGDGLVAVRVEDEGHGIDRRLRERLARPGATTRAGTDRGLGLSRVQAWLGAMGTELRVDAAPGGGASIGFDLPLAGPQNDRRARSGGRRILLVEDDLAVAEVLALLLCADGHEVRQEGDLQGARSAAGAGRFDLVLCDQNLPDGSGLEFVRELGAADGAPACFLVTGDPGSVHSGDCPLAGVLAKPVSRDDLRRAVAEAGSPRSPDPDES